MAEKEPGCVAVTTDGWLKHSLSPENEWVGWVGWVEWVEWRKLQEENVESNEPSPLLGMWVKELVE